MNSKNGAANRAALLGLDLRKPEVSTAPKTIRFFIVEISGVYKRAGKITPVAPGIRDFEKNRCPAQKYHWSRNAWEALPVSANVPRWFLVRGCYRRGLSRSHGAPASDRDEPDRETTPLIPNSSPNSWVSVHRNGICNPASMATSDCLIRLRCAAE